MLMRSPELHTRKTNRIAVAVFVPNVHCRYLYNHHMLNRFVFKDVCQETNPGVHSKSPCTWLMSPTTVSFTSVALYISVCLMTFELFSPAQAVACWDRLVLLPAVKPNLENYLGAHEMGSGCLAQGSKCNPPPSAYPRVEIVQQRSILMSHLANVLLATADG